MVKELRRSVTMAGKKKEEGKEYNGWGGPRPNSGRKKGSRNGAPGGPKIERQKRSIWSTKEEYEEVMRFLTELRNRNNQQGGQP